MILYSYFARRFLFAVLVVSGVFTGIVMMIEVVEQFSRLKNDLVSDHAADCDLGHIDDVFGIGTLIRTGDGAGRRAFGHEKPVGPCCGCAVVGPAYGVGF